MVLVLNLPPADASLAHQIAAAAQEITTAHAIPYVKMLGTRIVAAAGYATQSADGLKDAAPRLADVAIALRERCADPFRCRRWIGGIRHRARRRAHSQCQAGRRPGLFNLWGEAVQGADALAASAAAETIQVSEQAYLFLQQAFLFRPRGLFYRPVTGEARSYVLAGRA